MVALTLPRHGEDSQLTFYRLTDRPLVLLILVLGLLGLGIWIVFARFYSHPPSGIESGRLAAHDTCSRLEDFEKSVKDDASVTEVRAHLQEAETHAAAAANADVRWQALHGAVQSLRVAIEEDDPAAINLGLQVVAVECSRLVSES